METDFVTVPVDQIGNSQDFFASELLSELKQENERKDRQIAQKEKTNRIITSVLVVAIMAIVAMFLWYLNLYDFSSEQTISGVYALVDSDGNVVAQDITPEEYQQFLEESE